VTCWDWPQPETCWLAASDVAIIAAVFVFVLGFLLGLAVFR
jgi:hypothetical protein